MEKNFSFSSFPDSGDSSPRSREIDCENPATWDDASAPPPTAQRVKLMVSFGGRIQPRPHDNQLSYVGGDTKILAVDRSVRLPTVLSRIASITGSDDVCLKYQLPGEDLDALVSVTNDEDLEHLMLEYDRLCRAAAPGSKAAPRLRLFVFPIVSSQPSSTNSDTKSDRQWFVDALNSVAAPPPPQAPAVTAPAESPDYLFGLDKGFIPPPAIKVKDPSQEFAPPVEHAHPPPSRSEIPKNDDRAIGAEQPVEVQRQIPELQRFQIAENQDQPAFQRQASDENLSRVYPAEYYIPQRVQEKTPPAPPPVYWQEHLGMAAGGRFASVAGGDRQVFFIPAGPGVYQQQGAVIHPQAGQGYYAMAPPPRMVPSPAQEIYRESAAPVYAVSAPPPDGGAVRTQGHDAGFTAYDGAGRAVYYTGAAPTYQTVTNVAFNPDGKIVKQSQVS
ncbi:Thermostable phytase (3-phytase) protein [Dioscorea alata]|uniref:Thermostable phytase (3-phytase) protein n=1 Tax=Dioscorea alata TaxID=55571 RepID=A0ACB7WS38_DIOAL|nr:Thermostable phytase (3-phytase) protein [Dioscorea alata]